MSAFREFNLLYVQHLPNRTLINNNLTRFLHWTPDQFVINNLEALSFFRNLNELLLSGDTHSDVWPIFKVLEIALRHRSTRQYLIDTVRVITGVSKLALNDASHLTEEQENQIWLFIENITQDINIQTEEPYLTGLIKHLAASIMDGQMPKEMKTIKASVLTNLCFKNEIAVACLLRFVKTKPLLKSIFEPRVLWCKMAIAIAHFDCSLLEIELLTNLKFVFDFEYFSEIMRSRDHRFLNHILELLEIGLQRDAHSKNIMKQFDFSEPIEGVLQFIDNRMDLGDENELCESENLEHMDLFLGIINSILSVSNVSLHANMERLFTLAVDTIGSVNFSPVAIKTLRLMISNKLLDVESKDFASLIARLVDNMELHHLNSLVASEIYQLLFNILVQYPNIIIQVSQDVLNKSLDLDKWSFKLTNDNLSMQLYRLQWFMRYTSQYEILLPKLTCVMLNKDVHHIFASGLNNPNEDTCSVTMTLIKSTYFPLSSVSKLLSNVYSRESYSSKSKTSHQSACNCISMFENSKPLCVSTTLEKRLDVAVEQVLKKVNLNSSVEKVQLREILEYQEIIASSKERILQSQMKLSSDMISNQANEIGGLRSIVMQYRNNITELDLTNSNLKMNVEKLKTGYNLMKSKYDNKEKQFLDSIKKHEDMEVELKTLLTAATKQFERELNDVTTKHNNELTKLKQMKKDEEREKRDLISQHKKDLGDYSTKVILLKKELAESTELMNKCQQEIIRKDTILADKDIQLTENNKLLAEKDTKIQEYEVKFETVQKIFNYKN